jgi:hypothetical protein
VRRTCIDTLLFYEATNHFSLKGMNTMSLIDWKEQTSRFRATLTAVEHTKQIRQSLFPSSLPRGSQAPHFTLPATTQDTINGGGGPGRPAAVERFARNSHFDRQGLMAAGHNHKDSA